MRHLGALYAKIMDTTGTSVINVDHLPYGVPCIRENKGLHNKRGGTKEENPHPNDER